MTNRHEGMSIDHSGSGKALNLCDAFPHLWFVAVDGAFRAGGLVGAKWAMLNTFSGILE